MIRNTAFSYETVSLADTREQRRDDYLAAVEHSLELVRTSLDMDRLCALCRDIRSFSHVAFFGVLEAGSVALNLHSRLLMLGKLVFTKISVAEQLKFIRSSGADTLLVFFSETGADYDYGLEKLRQKAPDQQPKIWIVTDDPNAEQSGLYDGVLRFASAQDEMLGLYQLQVIADLIAQQYLQRAAKNVLYTQANAQLIEVTIRPWRTWLYVIDGIAVLGILACAFGFVMDIRRCKKQKAK